MKFKMLIAALAAATLGYAADMSTLPGSAPNTFLNRRMKPAAQDKAAIRAEVDETQGLLYAFAGETRNLSKKDLEPFFKSLNNEYYLGDYVGKARKSLEQMEDILDVQDAISACKALIKAAGVGNADAEEKRLLGLESDLMAAIDDLRGTLREIHKKASEDVNRDLRNWIMVSEGTLRNRREAAEASALSVSATAKPPSTSSGQVVVESESINLEGVSPAAAPLSATAGSK